jgi:predicted kinase
VSTLFVTRGLPASGKTTKARAWVAEDPERRARVNRDDLRAQLHDSTFIKRSADSPGTERAVQAARDAQITALLKAGIDVVSDDTNLPSRSARDLRKLAVSAGAEFEVWDLTDVPFDVCVARNAEREGRARVPDDRMLEMYQKFVRGKTYPLPLADETETAPADSVTPYVQPSPGSVPTAILVDLDGTAALMGDRGPYDWHRVGHDSVNGPVREAVLAMLARGHEVIFMSGRDEVCRPETLKWLREHFPETATLAAPDGMDAPELFMRPAGDQRKDAIVKAELFDAHIRGQYRIVAVFDDRDQVVRMWRAMGLTVFQVAEGNF